MPKWNRDNDVMMSCLLLLGVHSLGHVLLSPVTLPLLLKLTRKNLSTTLAREASLVQAKETWMIGKQIDIRPKACQAETRII
jgi:hypothetical protein